MRGNVENVNFSSFGESRDVVRMGRSRRAEGKGEWKGSGSNSVDGSFVGDGAEVENGIIIYFVVRFFVVVGV